MFIRAYLRASTKDQDANRAEEDLRAFARDRGLTIAATYRENESGASLKRPELFRLLSDSSAGDVLLVEQVDRLSRLNAEDWASLKAQIAERRIRVVALDLPTSWDMLEASRDDIHGRMLEAINGMMLDMLAAIARKDYEDRRRRAADGIRKAKAAGRYRGRPERAARNERIMNMLRQGRSWSDIIADQPGGPVSRSTLAKLSKRLKEEAESKVDPAAQAAPPNRIAS